MPPHPKRMWGRFWGMMEVMFRPWQRLGPIHHGGDAAVDALALGVEFRFVIRHHAYGAACVEVPGHIRQGEAKLRDLLHGPIKELIVVGFEMNLSAALQHLAVFFQEIPVG